MTLKLNGSTSGYTAIDAPASAGSNTLTLPTSNGSANQYLKNSGTAGELEFATLSAGKLVKHGEVLTTGTSNNTNSTSFVALHSSTFTPSSASNKVLVLWSAWVYCDNNNGSVHRTSAQIQITRNHSGISETQRWLGMFGQVYTENSGMDFITYHNATISFVDEPATTNEVTYTVNGKNDEAGCQLYIADSTTSRAWTFLELAPN